MENKIDINSFWDEDGYLVDDGELDTLIELENLDKLLSNFSILNRINPTLTKDTTIYEMANAIGAFSRFDNAKEKAKSFSNPIESLKLFVEKIEKVINGRKYKRNKNPNFVPYIYEQTLLGFGDNPLSIYVSWLINFEEIEIWDETKEEPKSEGKYILKEDVLFKIANGVVIAHKLASLKNEILEMQGLKTEDEEKIPDTTAPEKFTMYEMLGILEFIDKIFPSGSVPNERKAKLLSFLTNTRDAQPFKNCYAKRGIKKDKHYPFKEKNIEKCELFLSTLSIRPYKKIEK